MADLFYKQGPLDNKELKEFIEDYERNGRRDYQDTIDLGDDVKPEIQSLVNELGKTMGNLSDRLALTIIELSKRKPKQHSGDCSIYANLINDTPGAGVCTCGYGLHVMRETGEQDELYSRGLREKLMCIGGGI